MQLVPVDLPEELKLVAACCSVPSDRKTDRILKAVSLVRDWPRFLRVVARQRVAGLVHQALSAPSAPAIPPDVLQALQDARTAQVRLNLSLATESLRLDRSLGAAGIAVVFLKGATLAQMLHGEVGLRHSKDIDLLVAPEALPAAMAVLERAGYRIEQRMSEIPFAAISPTVHHFEMFNRERRTQVELHWRLCANPTMLPDIPSPETWDSVAIGGGQALRTLGKDDLLRYLCVHGALHGWFRLKWLADIAAILAVESEEDIIGLLDGAKGDGTIRAVAQGMLLAALLLGFEISPRVMSALPRDWRMGLLVKWALAVLTAGDGGTELTKLPFETTRVCLSHYLLRDGWGYLLAEMRLSLFSKDDLKDCPLPPWLSPLYPLMRVPMWLGRHARRWAGGCG